MNNNQLTTFFYVCGLSFIVMGITFPDSGLTSAGVIVLLFTYIVSKVYDKHILKKPVGV